MACIGYDYVARINVHGWNAEVFERQRDDFTGKSLAIAGDSIGGSRGKLTHDGNALDQFFHFLKETIDDAFKIGPPTFTYYAAAFRQMKRVQFLK